MAPFSSYLVNSKSLSDKNARYKKFQFAQANIANDASENKTDILCFLKSTNITVKTRNKNVSHVIVSILILSLPFRGQIPL